MSGCCRGLPAKVCASRPFGCADTPKENEAHRITALKATDALQDALAAAEARGIAVGRQEERERIALMIEARHCIGNEVLSGIRAHEVRALPHEPIKGDEGRGWRTIESAPQSNDKPFVWVMVVGGCYRTPVRVVAEGDHWREESHHSWCPTHWMSDPFASLPPPPTPTRPAQIGPDGAGERREGA